jgi:hypothetical protein
MVSLQPHRSSAWLIDLNQICAGFPMMNYNVPMAC